MVVSLNPRLLFIEDSDEFAEAIQRILAPTYQVIREQDAELGWKRLVDDPAYDLILLDRNLPGMDGIEFMALLRKDPERSLIPVVMQTGLATPEAIAEGLEAGVYYYLAKPFERKILIAVLGAALADSRRRKDLQERLEVATAGVDFMVSGEFRLRTPEEVSTLSPALARAFPDPDRVLVGISELLMNAVEHGNLGLDCDAKAGLMKERGWRQEIDRRLGSQPWASRFVIARFRRREDRIELEIEDQGNGFDWIPFLDLRLERALEPNGRGIAMARHLSFDEVQFRGRGNIVRAVIHLPVGRPASADRP